MRLPISISLAIRIVFWGALIHRPELPISSSYKWELLVLGQVFGEVAVDLTARLAVYCVHLIRSNLVQLR